MLAGRMKERLMVYAPSYDTDAFGSETVSRSEGKCIHAERVRYVGGVSRESGETFADYKAEYNIRWAHPVAENWHVEDTSGVLFIVRAVIPNRPRGYKTLVCEKLNT